MKTANDYILAAKESLGVPHHILPTLEFNIAAAAIELALAENGRALVAGFMTTPAGKLKIEYADRLEVAGFASPFLVGVEYRFAVSRKAVAAGRARVNRLLSAHVAKDVLERYIAGPAFILTKADADAAAFIERALVAFGVEVVPAELRPAGDTREVALGLESDLPANAGSYFLDLTPKGPPIIARAELGPEYRGPASLDPRW